MNLKQNGVLPKGWSDKQMSLKLTSSLLEENVKLQKEKKELQQKLEELMINVNDKMTQMVSALNEIKDKNPTIQQVIVSEDKVSKNKEKDVPVFIPTLESNILKSSISEIQKKTRKTDLEGSIRELTKLQENPKK